MSDILGPLELSAIAESDGFIRVKPFRRLIASHEELRAENAELKAKLAEVRGDSEMVKALLEADNNGFFDLTAKLDEHPEGYDRPCLCKLCQSYGDDAPSGNV